MPYVAADVLVDDDFASAGNKGFRPLANYIFSNNISMTAPVIVQAAGEHVWQVSFVMPEESTLEQMPSPNGPVRLRASEGEVCAALRFRGYTNTRKVAAMTRRIQALVQAHGLQATGVIRVARFDPPWKPGALRHNEVVVPISWPD